MRLLVLEDDPTLSATLSVGLGTQYSVDVAATLACAKELCAQNTYDLGLFDVSLPDGCGITFCASLRQAGLHWPILILTGNHQSRQVTCALDQGADDYLTKPFQSHELFARIRALLRRRSSSRNPLLRLGDLTLDPSSRTVTRSGSAIQLRKKEFSILEYLLRHPGTVVSRSTLLAHAWDGSRDPYPNTVDVHVKHLRDQIDRPFTQPLIHTVNGIGYTVRDTSSTQNV